MSDKNHLRLLLNAISAANARLVAVSKKRSALEIQDMYDFGIREFGENYVQELVLKQSSLPADIHWHFIGHLQSNKVKEIAPFVSLIHGVDSMRLVKEISKQAVYCNRTIPFLLQIHIATEETKFGLSVSEAKDLLLTVQKEEFRGIQISGLMGMASLTADDKQVRNEFRNLKVLFDVLKKLSGDQFNILSMGMSGDYKIALEEGSNMVRIGSAIFGAR